MEPWETHSSFVKVRTQSISEISHRLTSESALPTAKYLLQLHEVTIRIYTFSCLLCS